MQATNWCGETANIYCYSEIIMFRVFLKVKASLTVPVSLTKSCGVHIQKANVHFGFDFKATQQLEEMLKCDALVEFIRFHVTH